MGREVRMVPPEWQHPVREDGVTDKPLLEGPFSEALAEYNAEKAAWERGEFPEYASEASRALSFAEWHGAAPIAEDYMPEFPEGSCTHYQMYETCSEGTPISPVMESAEALARWLADNGASAFGNMTATYEQWLTTIKRGHAPSMFIDSTGIHSGVELP